MTEVFHRYRESRIKDPSSHPFYARLGHEDLVFSGRTSRFYSPCVRGTLSLRMTLTGTALHRVERTPLRLTPGKFLVLNSGQPYSVEIDSPEPVESFAVYFAPATVADVYHGMRTPELERALEARPDGAAPRLLDRLYPLQPLAPELHALRRAVGARRRPDRVELDGLVTGLLAALLRQQVEVGHELERLGAAKPSTRREHYRRLHRARDYMHSSLHTPLRMAELAEVAGLSSFHFQRLFRELFGTSVHGYLTGLRMDAAMLLLRRTDQPIDSIALAVGFEHASSLTRAFVRTQGVTPSEYRRRARG